MQHSGSSRWRPARAELTRPSTSARWEKHRSEAKFVRPARHARKRCRAVMPERQFGRMVRDSARGWTDQLIRLSRHADGTSGALCGRRACPVPVFFSLGPPVSLHKNRIFTLFLHAAHVLVLIALHKMTACSVASRVNTWVMVFHRRDRPGKSPTEDQSP